MNGQEKKFTIKEGCSPTLEMLQYMHPGLVCMVAWTNFWCTSHGITPIWTSWMRTAEENKALGATSTHIYRAADLSCDKKLGWTTKKQKMYMNSAGAIFKRIGAYSHAADGRVIRRPVIKHDSGHGLHFHLQVNPNASVDHLRSNLEEWRNEDY